MCVKKMCFNVKLDSLLFFFRRKRRKRGDNDFTVLFRKPINQIDIYARVGGVCNPNTSSILNKLQLCKYTNIIDHFTNRSDHFLSTTYMFIFRISEVQTDILSCWMSLNLNLPKVITQNAKMQKTQMSVFVQNR